MILDPAACYQAISARDLRFDGLFFVAVKTTGVYCRPICPARTPGRDRCVFYRVGAEAERDGFRACMRCRPELAPGGAPIDATERIAATAVARIHAGALNERSLDDLAAELGVSTRHLRRVIHAALGVSPIALAQSRRLALAKQLLHDSALPLTTIAFASGFRSLRRFNAAFDATFGKPPSALRRARTHEPRGETLTLSLDYRPPFAWEALLAFLAARAVPGVEAVRGDAYLRTLRVGSALGYVVVRPHAARHALQVEVSLSLAPSLMPLVARLRRAFDLDAHPEAIATQLARDPQLARHVRALPGLRVPGGFDGFEVLMRAILGQQVSVGAATTLASRLAAAIGEPIDTPHAELTRLAPLPRQVVGMTDHQLTALGILRARAASLRACAQAVVSGALVLEPGADAAASVAQLVAMPGIGPWTASYVAMRALSDPDAFPEGDLVLRKALGGVHARELHAAAEAWRPFRAYAALHLWNATPASAPRRKAQP